MAYSNYDVIIVGAGPAGATAAIGLARADFSVLLIEAGRFPGAENWSGCVYFTEALAHPDILGPEGVEALAWERRLVERGLFFTDGHALAGATYRSPETFRGCYTVLRPTFDHFLAKRAEAFGATLLCDTTVEGLIRETDAAGRARIVGVHTTRGPVYAPLVFLAEGDASHLVAKEGYELHAGEPDATQGPRPKAQGPRPNAQRPTPHFLQGIKEVIAMEPADIERLYGLGAEEGAAYEILLRNPLRDGETVHLNAAGFLYTNRASVSLGLVLPLDNLNDQFQGDHNRLMEWLKSLPEIRRWTEGGRSIGYGAKIIRGGGFREMPRLVDDGLAIGGAASGIGLDFPYPNFTGPACCMGRLLAQAARQIRDAGGNYAREQIERHYLEPLRATHYYRSVEHLRGWPEFAGRSRFFFTANLDLALGALSIWSRPERGERDKWSETARWLRSEFPPARLGELRGELTWMERALGLDSHGPRVAGHESDDRRPTTDDRRPTNGAASDREPRAASREPRPVTGELRFHYSRDGGREAVGAAPEFALRFLQHARPALCQAADLIYRHDATPISEKLPEAIRLVRGAIRPADLAVFAGLAARLAANAGMQAVRSLIGRGGAATRETAAALDRPNARTPERLDVVLPIEQKLNTIAYASEPVSHIKLFWPGSLEQREELRAAGLWHICPARVYEYPAGQLHPVVNYENCVKCESCWRISDAVDWTRSRRQGIAFQSGTPVEEKLLQLLRSLDLPPSRPPLALRSENGTLPEATPSAGGTPDGDTIAAGLDQLAAKLTRFSETLTAMPRLMDAADMAWLLALIEDERSLAAELRDVIVRADLTAADNRLAALGHPPFRAVWEDLERKLADRRTEAHGRKFFWAAADGRQILDHHLAILRSGVQAFRRSGVQGTNDERRTTKGEQLASEHPNARTPERLNADRFRQEIRTRLDESLDRHSLRDLDRGRPLSDGERALLRSLIAACASVGSVTTERPNVRTLGRMDSALPSDERRRVVMEELARKDPSLSVLVARHFLSCDLLTGYGGDAAHALLPSWQSGERIATIAHADWDPTVLEPTTAGAPAVSAVVERVFAALADDLLVVAEVRALPGDTPNAQGPTPKADRPIADRLYVFSREAPTLAWEARPQLGLHATGASRVTLSGAAPTLAIALPVGVRGVALMRLHGFPKLAAIALGAAETLLERARAYAETRVQFPGLFHDEQGRDTLLKFGAIKQMLSEMEARRLLLDTLASRVEGQGSGDEGQGSSVECRVSSVEGLEAGERGARSDEQLSGDARPSTLDPRPLTLVPRLTAAVAKVLVSEAFGTAVGSIAYNAFQVFGGLSFSAHDILEKFYRDSAEFLFLLGSDRALKCGIGVELTRGGFATLFPASDAGWIATVQSRGVLADVVNRYREALDRLEDACAAASDAATEVLAEDAIALSRLRLMLLRAHERLECGAAAIQDVEAARLFARDLAVQGTAFPHSLRARLQERAASLGAATFADGTWEHRALTPAPAEYAATLTAQGDYNFGDYLLAGADPDMARYCPEHIFADTELRAEYDRLRALFTARYRERRWDGLSYQRLLERLHRLPPEELTFLHEQGLMRRPIPPEFGGEGALKARYFLLTYLVARLGDFSTALTIQVNSTLGTLPLLNGLAEVRRERARRAQGVERAPGAHGKPVAAVGTGADGAGLPPTPFSLRPSDEELARREEALELLLRRVAAGEMTAFCLTEPGAGSDTARLATRAVPRRAEVFTDADDVKHFYLAASGTAALGERRNVLDVRRLVVEDRRLLYRYADAEPPAEICCDDYDYETDAPGRFRYYLHHGRRVEIHDIAQIRAEGDREYYEYFEISGSKLWITNSRWARIFCVYARTEAGITCFGLDRHAEGLVVGADEEKMGQHGSVTNALSFDRARVPRENILGLEGRGQVNALGTLTAGRLGLSLSCVALMQDVLDGVRRRRRSGATAAPAWANAQMGMIAAEIFAGEALIYGLIGRADAPDTKSIRLEAAVAKYYVSEALQRVVRAAEEIVGPDAHDAADDLEKKKRDTRIITVYEGSNQVQRLAILRALQADVLPRYRKSGASATTDHRPPTTDGQSTPKGQGPRPDAQGLMPKAQLLSLLDEADSVFGETLFTNPNFQPMAFLLAEIAAETLVMEAAAGRAAWVRAHGVDAEYARYAAEAAAWVVERGGAEIAARFDRFREMFAEARAGLYPPEVRLATLLAQHERPVTDERVPVGIEAEGALAPLEMAVLVKPVPLLSPQPRLEEGRLVEPGWTLDPAGAAALDAALRLKAAYYALPGSQGQRVRVTAIALGPRRAAEALRHALAHGADDVLWLAALTESAGTVARRLAGAVRAAGDEDSARLPDLVLAGEAALDTGRALIPALVAAELGWECLPAGAEIVLTGPGWRLRRGDARVPTPLVLTLPAGGNLPDFPISGFLRAMATDLPSASRGAGLPPGGLSSPSLAESIRSGAGLPPGDPALAHDGSAALESVQPAAPADGKVGATGTTDGTAADLHYVLPASLGARAAEQAAGGTRATPEEAAFVLLEQLGLSADGAGRAPFTGRMGRPAVSRGVDGSGPAVWYLPPPPAEWDCPEWSREAREGLTAAAALAGAVGRPLAVLALLPEMEETALRLLTAPLAAVRPAMVLLATSPTLGGASQRGFREALAALFPIFDGEARSPGNAAWQWGRGDWIVASGWAHDLLARLFQSAARIWPERVAFHGNVKEVAGRGEDLLLARAVFEGRLRAVDAVPGAPDTGTVTRLVTLAPGARVLASDARSEGAGERGSESAVYHLPLNLRYDRLADPLPPLVTRSLTLSLSRSVPLRDAECVLDVGYGIGSRDQLDRLVLPLQRLLEAAGARRVAIGGTRRVTEELKLLPPDAQIGQTGLPVNPPVLIALGVSGAPQHVDYIGDRGIVLAFNRDPDAPLMTLNRHRASPRVYPVVGDLFETLPRFTSALRRAVGLPEAAPPSLSGAARVGEAR
jgi:electron transfer flavoprotein-quinone oxidoreductase